MKTLLLLSLFAIINAQAMDYYSKDKEEISEIKIKLDATGAATLPTYTFEFNMKDDKIDKDFVQSSVKECSKHLVDILLKNPKGEYVLSLYTYKGMVRGVGWNGAYIYESTPYYKCISALIMEKHKVQWLPAYIR